MATAALVLCSGCIARHVRIQEKGLTCADAHHLAIEAVHRMGYEISEVTKPTPSVPGMILGSRQDGINKHALMVSVFCTTQGAEVEAKSDQTGLAAMDFPTEFRRSFAAAAANQAPPRAAAAHGVDLLLVPARDGGREQLGVDLSGLGILPVSVRITNHTSRTYVFKSKGVRLETAAGTHAAPLAVADVTARLSPEAASSLRQKVVERAELKPDDAASGVLLFPFDAYTGARVELLDRASNETEGFAVEF